MEIISSKIKVSFKRLIIPGVLILVLNALFALFFIENFFAQYSINESTVGLMLIGLFLIGMADYFAFVYALMAYPKVRIFDDRISIDNLFSKNGVDFSDVKSVDLYGLKSVNFFFYSFKADAVEIERLNGEKLFVFVDSYRNSQELRLTFADKFKVANLGDLVVKEISEDLGELVIINKWSFFVLYFWYLMFISFFLIFIGNKTDYPWIPYLFLIAAIYLGSFMLNYIQYNDKFVVIRNNLKPWYTDKYRIEDMVNIIFDSRGRGPRTMTIILKDFSKRTYVVQSVGEKNLTNFSHLLAEKGIEVNGFIF